VLGDVKDVSLAAAPAPAIYLAFPQLPWTYLHLSLRTAVSPMSLAAAVRRQISAIDPDQPVTHVQTLATLVASASARPRFNTVLFAIFAALALALATVGIYGVMAASVAQRTQEIGLRSALGASAADTLRLVVGQGLRLVLAGLALGLAAALALTRIVSSLLYQASALDPLAFGASIVLFLSIGLLACYLPARRAARVDPAVALRCD